MSVEAKLIHTELLMPVAGLLVVEAGTVSRLTTFAGLLQAVAGEVLWLV
jgi:hypothetical protein